ncbi:AAA family ATPase [Pseudomonas syringae]|uniref:AAA family ATPase n=1 Tax=Pseudomonas syringae TaxID=317 RepID=UPI003F755EC8
MIKSIQKIKGLGVYADYSRPADTQEFASKNLIYGWNYSGKTTLSRLFGLLESKKVNSDLNECSFTFDTHDGPITERNYIQSNSIVRVFNSDFIADNLNFSGQAFDPILLLGAESEEAQKRLEKCDSMAKKIRDLNSSLGKNITQLERDLSTAKTKAAAHIKKELSLVAAYSSSHMEKDIAIVAASDESPTLSDEKFRDDLRLALSSEQEQPSEIAEITVSLSLTGVFAEAESLMAKTPSLESTIEHLVKNPTIELWVEAGLPHHEGKNKCEFCEGHLSGQRMAQLEAHFSKDLADHKREINQLLSRVERSQASVDLPNDMEFNARFREAYSKAKAELETPIKEFNDAVRQLADDIRRKIAAPFEPACPRPLNDFLTTPIEDAVEDINALIRENNHCAQSFLSAKAKAVERLKKHYVQEFIELWGRGGQDKALQRIKRNQDRLARFDRALTLEVQRLKAIISHAQRGREEINLRLESLLGVQSVQIKVIQLGDTERFQLVRRDGGPAKNLSEGEKTAIAFAFFLTKLKELTPEQFKETIVYIDDPISSLDSNHIFQVTAIIKEFFFHQPLENGPWVTRCAQTFFSTHNFEFFALLRELSPTNQQARHFLIRRINPNESSLTNMPKSLFRYSSEYHFLFDILNTFRSAPDKTEFNVLMLLPNAVRRFVELYTFARYPGDRELSVDKRADRIFGTEKSKRILKVLHYFSHANNIERLSENNELIFDIEAAVNELINTIKAIDPMHMEALEAAVS